MTDQLPQSHKTYEPYVSQQPTNYSEKSNRKEQLNTINKTSPLQFSLRINGKYYISFERKQFRPLLIRSIVLFLINILIIYVLDSFENISQGFKDIVRIGLIAQAVIHFLLCFLDPGTIFQDEDDSYGEDRTFCMTCSIYRLRSSKHCMWCNKCVQRYDHHCSVFGKCIAKRNIWLFWLFMLLSGIEGPLLIILFIFQIAQPSK